MEAGAHAPSGDNCQPWRFRWDGERLRVIFLSERAESLYDVEGTASWLSLGAVLANMRLAASARGFELAVVLSPEDESAGVVARVGFVQAEPTAQPLAAAIPARCVNRRPYQRRPLAAAIRDELVALAAAEPGTHLSWIDPGRTLARLAALAARNDRILFENRALHQGLYRWLRWTAEEAERTRDGMPVGSLELSPLERPGFRLLRAWRWARLCSVLGVTRLLPMRARWTYRSSGAIALLTVDRRRREDVVRAGEVLERIWLTAALRGLAFQPITGLTFLLLRLKLAGGEGLSPRHRRLLERLSRQFEDVFPRTRAAIPVMLFRLGVAPSPSARAPRLAPETLLSIE